MTGKMTKTITQHNWLYIKTKHNSTRIICFFEYMVRTKYKIIFATVINACLLKLNI